jgi:hypothetical protein
MRATPEIGGAMDKRAMWVAVGLWLATCTTFVIWFDVAAATALLHPGSDAVGHTVFQVPPNSNTVFPFTYIAAAASVLGVIICVFRRERGGMPAVAAAFIALLVGNLASIGMINCFEQVFLGLRYFTVWNHSAAANYLILYWWNSATGAGITAGGMLVVLAVLPWSRRQNWPGVLVCLGVYGVCMATWFLHGYGDPQSGDALDYWMNAAARVASQLAVVAAVLPRDAIAVLFGKLRDARIRPQDSPSNVKDTPVAD